MNLRTFALLALALALAACGNKQSGTKAEPGSPSVAGEPAAAVEPEEPNRILVTAADGALAAWLAAQNAGDFDAYIALYDAAFTGVRRTPDGGVKELDLPGWKADREKMFRGKLEVAIDDEEMSYEGKGGELTFSFSFTQRFRSGKYADHGRKLITINGNGTIVREEMVWSKPGWDDSADDPATATVTAAAGSFVDLVNGASLSTEQKIDARTFGTAVEIYLVTRVGAPADQDETGSQSQDLSLVIAGGGMTMRVALGRNDVWKDRQEPFGTMSVTKPFAKRKFDADEDGFPTAPRFKSKAPVLVATSITDLSQDTEAHVVTKEQDSLVVWFAEEAWESYVSETWEKEVTITLAAGATVTVPKVTIAHAPLADRVPVRVVERLVGESKGYRSYALELQVGDRVGPVGAPDVKVADGDEPWTFEVKPIAPADLPVSAPLPPAERVHAHRLYKDGDFRQIFVLGTVGDDLVLWRRTDSSDAGVWDVGEWREQARIALPPGAKLEVR